MFEHVTEVGGQIPRRSFLWETGAASRRTPHSCWGIERLSRRCIRADRRRGMVSAFAGRWSPQSGEVRS